MHFNVFPHACDFPWKTQRTGWNRPLDVNPSLIQPLISLNSKFIYYFGGINITELFH